jgi:aminoglycoside phosphotransferase family enzyme/predicted kinase
MFDPAVYDHPVDHVELIETHISWVLLTGQYAYKVKKPVNFGFLDFSTLELRRECCEQELRLNRRLAPDIYLEVVAITLTPDKPVINGDGEVIEYAVRMSQFPQSAQFDNMLAAGTLNVDHIDALAHMVAEFHQSIQVADASMDFGNSESVYGPVEENFIQINQHMDTHAYTDALTQLQQWSQSEFDRLKPVFVQRKQAGFIRECHGDMHLRNLIWLDGAPRAFDCIEFNPQLRWIDVISEVAFLMMDLQDRQQPRLANRFINSYLEATGDYAGLALLSYYLCYRAMVRAKVDALRLEQNNISADEKVHATAEFESYIELASHYTTQSRPRLIIMRGMSASGKSTVSQQLLEAMPAIRIRSDVERKRLFNIAAMDRASSDVDTGIYTRQASLQTYERLLELAQVIIEAGFNVIVDAAFLKYEQRVAFQKTAAELAIPYAIVEVTAPDDVLRQRITSRVKGVSDADLSILEHQLSNREELHESELNSAILQDTSEAIDYGALIQSIVSVH